MLLGIRTISLSWRPHYTYGKHLKMLLKKKVSSVSQQGGRAWHMSSAGGFASAKGFALLLLTRSTTAQAAFLPRPHLTFTSTLWAACPGLQLMPACAQEVCGRLHDEQALEGTIVGRIQEPVGEDGYAQCLWHIWPKQRLKYIEFNTSSSSNIELHDSLAFYTGKGRGGMYGLISTFTGARPPRRSPSSTAVANVVRVCCAACLRSSSGDPEGDGAHRL